MRPNSSSGAWAHPARGRKGFALTLDAAIAVLIALFMITGAMFYISQNSHLPLEDPVFVNSIDSLAILEKKGGLAEFVSSGSDTKLEELFGPLPYENCVRLTFYQVQEDLGLEKLETYSREGCRYPEDYTITRRIFADEGEIYMAELVGWRR